MAIACLALAASTPTYTTLSSLMARPPLLGARLGTPEQPPPAQAAKGMGGPPLTSRSYGLVRQGAGPCPGSRSSTTPSRPRPNDARARGQGTGPPLEIGK